MTSAAKPRRTQAERRAATRAALLQAAIDTLVEEGYTAMTTRRVAERAGVSQGTQMHYFPTKTEFVGAALRHLAERIAAEILARVDLRDLSQARRRAELLDQAWRVHTGPEVQAAMELWMAARTDPDLQPVLRELYDSVLGILNEVGGSLFPDVSADPEFLELIDITLSAIRGLAMLPPVADPELLEEHWQATKRLLLELHEQKLDG
jgi:AcrR family transcriptional regulator